ncbi:nickel-dependent hydrogenase large subunit [Arcobacter lacus]|uniref:nickel-dependent hydrogenase large subunit n=1 Tax=Arcobacter lacus TaxID=1912876 RepID=UPI0021BABE0D|nr:nickel-dependent hydrogenase large subunit [Arcobacter lacus]MCT7908641.1 nickel-dependent hydrogenase large subunit [Arcobacter lacus]
MKTVNLVERIEGEAKLNCSWKNGIITDSRIDFLNFRGFEYILEGKSPLDALIYTPRICGICGQAHLNTTVDVLEKAYENIGEKLEITPKAKLLRQIGLNIEIIDSHIKWFYMFILPDVIKLSTNDLNGYEPLKGKKWLEACKVASETIKALAIIAGQWPHSSYMLPGGVMSDPTKMDLVNMQNYLQIAINFFEDNIVSISLDDYLSFGSFDNFEKIGGDLKLFRDLSFKYNLQNFGKSYNKFISLGNTNIFKKGKFRSKLVNKIDLSKVLENNDFTFSLSGDNTQKHTWSKSVTYNDSFFETGPLARAIISNRKFMKDIHKNFDDSVFTRVVARIDELAFLLEDTKNLISRVNIKEASFIKPKISLNKVDKAEATAVVEATRGSLYHKIDIEKGKIKFYDVITPTVWNLGPQNKKEKGIAQNAIIGTSSIDIAKIILRSFDVCSVCTTH